MDSRRSRVAKGGVFHLPRVQYSDDTRELLKGLMADCHVSMLKRRNLDKFISGGEPLPDLKNQHRMSGAMTISHAATANPTRRRSKEVIVQSGAYIRDPPPSFMPGSGEGEKLRLQKLMAGPELMACGTTAPQSTSRSSSKQPISQADRFDEFLEEIRERYQFLCDAAELGHAEKYRGLIEAEIATKWRAMRALDPQRCEVERRRLSHTLSTLGPAQLR